MRRSGHDLVVRVHTVDYGDTRSHKVGSSCGGISWVCSGRCDCVPVMAVNMCNP